MVNKCAGCLRIIKDEDPWVYGRKPSKSKGSKLFWHVICYSQAVADFNTSKLKNVVNKSNII